MKGPHKRPKKSDVLFENYLNLLAIMSLVISNLIKWAHIVLKLDRKRQKIGENNPKLWREISYKNMWLA